jgi:serine/threonine protein kinase
MVATANVARFDPERTRVEGHGAGPSTRPLPVVESLGRGSILGGKYRLELLLGEGGMGFVWSAYNTELELPVAIKLLRAGSSNATLVERLRLEARAAARLVHSSIVRIFDIALADNGDPFIVMELLSGENLAQRLARGRLSGVEAVQLLLPIADGLALAHGKGIIHRDLKPDNVFLAKEEGQVQPKLLDFGIAKHLYGRAMAGKLTSRGTLLGSPSYMSPEQASGDDVDDRSDIWSFCVMLYELVTGRAPFSARDKRSLIRAIMSSEPAPHITEPGVDPELAQLIEWGLRKNREQRPRSMRELGQHLARWLRNQGIAEDATGGSLSAKWAVHPIDSSPSMARPSTARSGPTAATLVSRNSNAVTVPFVRPPRAAVRRHYWAALAAGSLLLVGGSAWTASAPPPAQANATMKASPLVLPETTIFGPDSPTLAVAEPEEITEVAAPPPRPAPKTPRKPAPLASRLPF